MTYTIQPHGVCSRSMTVETDDQGVIQKLEVVGGCDGNLKGISALVVGMKAEETARAVAPPARISWHRALKRRWPRSNSSQTGNRKYSPGALGAPGLLLCTEPGEAA